MSKTKMVG